MSRVGNKPVPIPSTVRVAINHNRITAEGPLGRSELELPPLTSASVQDNQVVLIRKDNTSRSKSMHGLARSLVNNLVCGVNRGFEKSLEIHGVGFKAVSKNNIITLNLGYSHDINYKFPDGIKISIDENNKIHIKGLDKQLVGKVAAEIRSYYPPEPYKGKGVRYLGETVTRKEGKTVQ